MAGKKQRLYCETIGDVTTVNLMDKKILDEAVIQELGEDLFNLVDQHYKVKLVLNFEKVEFLSSAALGKLITLTLTDAAAVCARFDVVTHTVI